ncbi:hypothetical protein P154DRAFT_131507 [Amniculicola lignicola CBS 123094]|uniref:Uncharacterized protein n=1 Tax=Amniculicola lignicola CBS 123094 TaxID=1392246 RepID=A0A6A5WLQ1_9PLEO|nr:hypothetical protein P154DRAFT_131507 [Amniculicola lignicola CBS 123094]
MPAWARSMFHDLPQMRSHALCVSLTHQAQQARAAAFNTSRRPPEGRHMALSRSLRPTPTSWLCSGGVAAPRNFKSERGRPFRANHGRCLPESWPLTRLSDAPGNGREPSCAWPFGLHRLLAAPCSHPCPYAPHSRPRLNNSGLTLAPRARPTNAIPACGNISRSISSAKQVTFNLAVVGDSI